MSSVNTQEILQHAHSMVVEYCLLNGDSHTNLIHAITRDIYPTQTTKQTRPFHLNIKPCRAPSHHKYGRNIHIIHFAQIKWISTLEQRPRTMLPTAHHLILFFNHIHLSNLDLNLTNSIREEFIVQCLMSMNPEDTTQWNQLLARYCIPYDFCPNYEALNQLTAHNKSSKVFSEFASNHPWPSFTDTLRQWCERVLNELQLTPNDALLCRLTEGLKRMNLADTSDSNRSTSKNKKQQIVILSDEEEEEDHHGLKLMSSKDSMNEEEIEPMEQEDAVTDVECKRDTISEDHSDLDSAKLPQSMPSLEEGSQSIQMDDAPPVESTQEDDYEDINEPLTQNTKQNKLRVEESPDLCEDGASGSIGASQINGDISQQSEVSTSELLQSQPNIQDMEQTEYPVPSQPPSGGFNFGAFSHALDRNELLPQDADISETESPPEHNSVFVPSQMPMEVEPSIAFRADYLSQNKPPSNVSSMAASTQNVSQNRDQRGTKRRYDEMERLSDEAPLTQNVKRAKVIRNGDHGTQEQKVKYMREDHHWPSWIKRGIEVTVELEDEIWLSIIRKVSTQFVLIKITDEDAPDKYRQQQFKICLKDKDKIERVMDLHDTQSQSPNDMDKPQGRWPPLESERVSQENLEASSGSGSSLTQPVERISGKPKSLLKRNADNINETTQKNHVRWNLTLSQEQRENDRERKKSDYGGGIEMEWDEEEEEERPSVYDSFESTSFTSQSMPQRLINREYITDPDKACGLRQSDEEEENRNRNNKFKIRGRKKKKRTQRIPWTDQEIECLIKGVEKYKKHEHAPRGKQGMWSYIMKDPKFGKVLIKNKRENANLCDKWRHLVQKKDPRVTHLLEDDGDSKSNSKMPKLSTRPVR